MTELKLNVDSKDIIEAGDPKSAQRGMLTFSKNTVYLGDGDKANKIIDSEGNTAVVNLTGNQTIAGTKTFSSPVVVPNGTENNHAVNLSQLNTKANQANTYTKIETNNLVNAKIDSTKATKLLTENLVKTVGASGADFANLRQALEWASQYSYSGGRFTITLRCNADMPIPGVYLPIGEAIIIIDGQNNTFNCDSEYFMTFAVTSLFNHGNNGNTVLIRNFTLNYNGITANTYGCAFQITGINVTFDNITININNSNINNCLIANQGLAYLYIQNSTINCSGNSNIGTVAFTGSFANLFCSDLVVNTTNLNGQIQSLFSFDSSTGNLHQYNVEKPAYPTDKIVTQINLYSGSIVRCGNRFNDSKLSIATNTLTSNGIIFKS